MNGRTFTAGIGGTVRVALVNCNISNDDGERESSRHVDQGHLNAEVTGFTGVGTPGVALRNSDDVVVNDFPNVTVIGVRRTGLWTFACQKRAQTAPARVATAVIPGYRWVSVHNVR
jgi:hypothetical protein